MPGYVEKAAELKAKGVEVIACIAVNDPFVMEAWGKAHNADGKASFFRHNSVGIITSHRCDQRDYRKPDTDCTESSPPVSAAIYGYLVRIQQHTASESSWVS